MKNVRVPDNSYNSVHVPTRYENCKLFPASDDKYNVLLQLQLGNCAYYRGMCNNSPRLRWHNLQSKLSITRNVYFHVDWHNIKLPAYQTSPSKHNTVLILCKCMTRSTDSIDTKTNKYAQIKTYTGPTLTVKNTNLKSRVTLKNELRERSSQKTAPSGITAIFFTLWNPFSTWIEIPVAWNTCVRDGSQSRTG